MQTFDGTARGNYKIEEDSRRLDALAASWGITACGGRGAPVEVWDDEQVTVLWAGTLAYVTEDGWAGVIGEGGRLDEAPAWQVHASRGGVRA